MLEELSTGEGNRTVSWTGARASTCYYRQEKSSALNEGRREDSLCSGHRPEDSVKITLCSGLQHGVIDFTNS